jgi:carboxypeptidase T
LATWSDVGDSWARTQDPEDGYDLMVLRLTNSALPGPKPGLFVMAAVHAREYATAELATRFGEYLLANYGSDADATWLLDHHEIHLMLQANPDGRKIAEMGVYWRKNVDSDDGCSNKDLWGTDLNRNFSFRWHGCDNESCSSSLPCNEVYRGPAAASEPETAAIEAYVRGHFPDQRPEDPALPAPADSSGVFLDLHSFGGLVLWPWGYGGTTANDTAFQTLGRKLAYYNGYSPSIASDLYPTDGDTTDFAYGELGLAAIAFEVGTAFFQGCTTFENTILPDNLPALLYAAKVARRPYLTPAGPDVLAPTISTPAGVGRAALQLTATADDGRYSAENGIEPTQVISAAGYTVDLPPWDPAAVAYPMAAADGAFDEEVEALEAGVDTAGLGGGRHMLFLRAQDAAGNWGAVSAVFLDVAFDHALWLPLVTR